MTYNFDPDRWLENERAFLESRRKKGDLGKAAFQDAMADLERRYEEMWKRLDGSYRIDADGHGEPDKRGERQ
jgi:hypothetical protein